jgi:hypothetical protein
VHWKTLCKKDHIKRDNIDINIDKIDKLLNL